MADSIATIDVDGALTVTGHTDRVAWWSFTKTVLSIATLRLAERGALDLDDRLPGRPFTARQLLRHEAGLPDYGCVPRYQSDVAAYKPPWPVDRLLKAVDIDRLRYQPGSGWAYSNVGYLLVAQLIEVIARQDLSAALAALIFAPAGLKSARLATRPDHLDDVQMAGASGYHPGWVYHGLVVGTVADAARLLRLVVTGDMLSPTSLASMKDCRPLPMHATEIHPNPAYGLGLMLSAEDPEAHPLGHSGEGPGSRIAVYARDRKVAAMWTPLPCERDPDAALYEMLA